MAKDPTPKLTKDDLEELLHSKVDSFTISPLTAPGENYGSTMLLVEAILLPDHRKISIAAKLVSEFPHMREIFHFRETVLKEIYMYERVRPALLAIQKEYKVPEDMFLDVIPRCYGARTSRGGGIDQPVDESSVILMENLKVSGYRLVDRIAGLDLKHLEYVVTHLARFHATPIVLKLKKPDVFKDTVMKAAFYFRAGPPSGEEDKAPTDVLNSLSHLPTVRKYYDKIKEAMENKHEFMHRKVPPEAREPFATLVHNDFWTNNMMFRYSESDGDIITGYKIFDFQMTSYSSPVKDLLFILYSSRSLDVGQEDCDRLFKVYHHEFTKWLRLFGCDAEHFDYEHFWKEVESEAYLMFPHAFVMLRVICLPESSVPDISSSSDHGNMFSNLKGLGESYFKKVENLVEEFVRRNWL